MKAEFILTMNGGPHLPELVYQTGRKVVVKREVEDENGDMIIADVEVDEVAGGFTILESPVEDGQYHAIIESSPEIIEQMKQNTQLYTFVKYIED